MKTFKKKIKIGIIMLILPILWVVGFMSNVAFAAPLPLPITGVVTFNGTATDGVTVTMQDVTNVSNIISIVTSGGGFYTSNTSNLTPIPLAGDSIQLVASFNGFYATTTVANTDPGTGYITANIAITSLSSAKAITAFSFASPAATGVITGTNIALTVPNNTNVTALVPTITISANATINPASGVAQDFTNPVTYTVTAQDLTTQAYVVTVTIAPPVTTYTLTYTAGANGAITGASPQTVNSGTSGTAVTAVPNANFHFVNWSDGSTANPRTDTNVLANISVTANFAINTFTITSSAGANGSISPLGATVVNYGASQTYTITPNAGFNVADVLVDGVSAGATTTYAFNSVAANHTIAASFSAIPPTTYTLTYTAGANGAITGTSPQTVNAGANGSTVTAVANAGFHFVNWSDGVLTASRTDLAVVGNITVTANFAANPVTFTLTYTAGANGTITGTSPQTVNSGASGTVVTAVPNVNFHFVNWSDGSTANPRTDTNVLANISVTANFAADAPVLATITISPATATTTVGATQQFTATAYDQYGAALATQPTFTWASASTTIATVDATGLATGISAGGPISITATSGVVSGSANLTITAVPVLTTITVSPANASIAAGNTQQFTAAALDQFSNPIAATIAWSSSNMAAATIDAAGLATGFAIGTSTITASSGAVSGTANLTVTAVPVLTTITVSPTIATTTVGATQQFVATALDQFSNPITASLTWASSNLAAGTINASGLFSALAAGTSTITAASGAVSGTAQVVVVAPALTTINVTPAIATTTVGATQQFTATAYDQFNVALAVQPAFAWTSASTTIATVNATGLATGVAAGSVNITATSGAVSGSATLNVEVPILTSIAVTPANPILKVAATLQMRATGLDQSGMALIIQPAFAWASSNNAVASISSTTGLATGLAVGASTITATSGAISGTAALTVSTSTRIDLECDGIREIEKELEDSGSLIPEINDDYASTTALTATHDTHIRIISPDGDDSVDLPDGVRITSEDGSPFDGRTLTATSTKENSLIGFAANEQAKGAVRWGMANKTLVFSAPITVSIYVGAALNGQTLNIRRSPSGSTGWTADGIVAPATCVVANGLCTFQATKASYYAATAITPVTPPPSSGGGGGGNIGGTVITPSSSSSVPAPETSAPSIDKAAPTPTKVVPPQVLGEKIYADGTLLRGADMKIYVIVNGMKQQIRTLAQLQNYKGRPIYKVSAEVLAAYSEVLGAKIYANGQLIRGADMKIYVIVNGMKKLIRSLAELRNYKGQKIYDVNSDVLAQYPMVLGVKIYANGQLIRGADMRIYAIVDGAKLHLKTLAQLNAYRGRPIYSVTADVLAGYPNAN